MIWTLRSVRNDSMRSRVDVEAALAEEPHEGHVGGEGHLHGHARGRGHRGHYGDARLERLLHDLEARPAAHHEGVAIERHPVGEDHVADHLVHRIVAADVLAEDDETPFGVEETRRVEPARLVEDWLRLVHGAGDSTE